MLDNRTQVKEGGQEKQEIFKLDGVITQDQAHALVEPIVQASFKGLVSALLLRWECADSSAVKLRTGLWRHRLGENAHIARRN